MHRINLLIAVLQVMFLLPAGSVFSAETKGEKHGESRAAGQVINSTIKDSADDDVVTKLGRRPENQRSQIARLRSRLSALEDKVVGAGGEPTGMKRSATKSSWTERIKFHGDLRYRIETIDQSAEDTRHRHRIRARLGLASRTSEDVQFGLQIATGGDDPVSTNQTLGDGFSSKSLRLDLAYMKWHPKDFSALNLVGGKIKNPFYRVAKTELLWDSDLNPEGAALAYSPKLGNWKFFSTLGGFWIEERNGVADSWLWGVQGGLHYAQEHRVELVMGASYFDYMNAKGEPTFYDTSDSFGNRVDTSGHYRFDYNLLESFACVEIQPGLPVVLFADYVTNTAAADENYGWLSGVKVGAGKGDVRYSYRELRRDAVVGAFTDSDFIDGGTGGRGHELGVDYRLAGVAKLGMTYFLNDKTQERGNDYHRLQVDFGIKF